jgi:hypothetical protein
MNPELKAKNQAIYEICLKDDRLRCTCDEIIREESWFQAQGHYHQCMLYQVARAIELSQRETLKEIEDAVTYQELAERLFRICDKKRMALTSSIAYFNSEQARKLILEKDSKYASEIRSLIDWQEALEEQLKAEKTKIAIIKNVIDKAVKDASKLPQPQDMKTRLTFSFDEFNQLSEVLK